ncbi:MAG: copper amine oxidase N-terminal domain-containing protein [Symbiobacteriaceae bacterium]|nr:copper amine oxidase N-terminal domain-containing protein [Symbiobacteriaceae bacterium]
MVKRLLVLVFVAVIIISGGVIASEADTLRVLEVFGFLTGGNEVVFDPAYAIIIPSDAWEPEAGEYSFQAIGRMGEVLAETNFQPVRVTEYAEEVVRYFDFAALFPAGTDHFNLYDEHGVHLAELPISRSMPQAEFAELTFNTSDPFTLIWNWQSPEGLQLYAELYYISDYYSEIIDFDLTDNFYEIDFAEMGFDASGNGFFLLVVSDGANTIEVYSNTFAIPGEVTLQTANVFQVLAPEEALPSATRENVICLTIDSKLVTKDDLILEEPPVPPQIINGRTMLPFRYLVEVVLNGEVFYEAETRQITANVSGHQFYMIVDQTEIKVDNLVIDFGQAPTIVAGYTLVPLRAFASLFDELTWNPDSMQVHLVP